MKHPGPLRKIVRDWYSSETGALIEELECGHHALLTLHGGFGYQSRYCQRCLAAPPAVRAPPVSRAACCGECGKALVGPHQKRYCSPNCGSRAWRRRPLPAPSS